MRTFLFFVCIFSFAQLRAQDKKALDSLDKAVIAEIIKPAETATPEGEEPDWEMIKKQVADKYSATEADRAVTKAQIYYSYSKNWPMFCAAIIHYTDAYENKDDLKLMNYNANYILEHSEKPEEWKAALRWMKHAVDKEPTNERYKQTYDALAVKIQNHG